MGDGPSYGARQEREAVLYPDPSGPRRKRPTLVTTGDPDKVALDGPRWRCWACGREDLTSPVCPCNTGIVPGHTVEPALNAVAHDQARTAGVLQEVVASLRQQIERSRDRETLDDLWELVLLAATMLQRAETRRGEQA